MSAHVLDHSPLTQGGRQGVDVRLLELTKIFDDQLPLMGKTLNKICDNSYASIVIVLHKKEGTCQVIGGCTFRIHKTERIIELLLLGVKTSFQRAFGVGTKIINALKTHASESNMPSIVAYADWRALEFFKK